MHHFLTQKIYNRLLENGREQQELSARGELKYHVPAVLLFLAGTEFKWLLTEINPDLTDEAFGLCDLGMGFPEMGFVSLTELEELKSPFGLKVERDITFETDKNLEYFVDLANKHSRIVLSDDNKPLPPNLYSSR